MSFRYGGHGGGLGGGLGRGYGAYGASGAYGAAGPYGAGASGAYGAAGPYGAGAGGAYGAGGADCATACCASTSACMGCGPACGVACAEGSGCGAGGSTILSYVGAGGDYVQETTYRYVGMGAGEFGVVRIPGRGPSCCLLVIPLGLCLLLLPLLLFALKKINCGEGDVVSWDVPKKVYCCLHEGKGCPTTPAAPSTMPMPVVTTARSTTSPCPIDCNAGYNDLDPLQWVRGWSGEKKLYCCKSDLASYPQHMGVSQCMVVVEGQRRRRRPGLRSARGDPRRRPRGEGT
ncbi:unnamed protein product [Prorocentrum cordatum]|uniref:Uncharacterized protein n=1 Tax=Prorocentrum cordatum TaxID=2364126 RepID=A0ABN9S3D6_9DINO|nr:unnamed protein product [Polarella glacialis]